MKARVAVGFHILGLHREGELVHQLAPGPETVLRRGAALLCVSGHGTLEAMAVEVGHTGQRDVPPPGTPVSTFEISPFETESLTSSRPAAWQQRMAKNQRAQTLDNSFLVA